MRVFKTIVKAALSIGGMILLGSSGGSFDPLGAITVFAVLYGLITYYMYSFANSDGFLVGDGLISMAFAMVLNLGLPLLVIMIPMFILQALLGEIGMIIFSIAILIVCVGCILGDIIHIARLFKPDFLGGLGDIFDLGSDD